MSELLTDFSGLNNSKAVSKQLDTAPIRSVAVLPVDNSELTLEQATKLTDSIRNATEVMWVLISRAHTGKAWVALGYESWEEYVYSEFDMSRSRSYQLLDQSKVIKEIQASVPAGTEIHMTEAAARDLKGILDEVIPQIKEKTSGLIPQEASIVVDQIIEQKRQQLGESKQEALLREREEAYSRADEESARLDGYPTEGRQNVGRDGYPEFEPVPGNPLEAMKPPVPKVNNVDSEKIRRNVNAAHDIYSSLSALSSLPETLEEVVDVIAPERYAQIDKHIEKAMENLLKFNELWLAKKAAEEDQE